MENLIGIGRSESYVDLNNPEFARTLMSSTGNLFVAAAAAASFSGKSSTEDPLNAAAVNNVKPFGLGELHDFHRVSFLLLIFPLHPDTFTEYTPLTKTFIENSFFMLSRVLGSVC